MIINKKTHNSYSLKYSHCNHTLKFGRVGIKVLSFGRLTDNQFISIERSLLKLLKNVTNNKKLIKIWSLISFNLTLTKLSSESRMGKGKGAIYSKAVFLRPGTILFEFEGISNQQTFIILNFLEKKIPFKIVLIKNYID